MHSFRYFLPIVTNTECGQRGGADEDVALTKLTVAFGTCFAWRLEISI
jgi:hypothetical protein